MICSFRDKISRAILEGQVIPKRLPYEIQRKARMKLLQINNARKLEDLTIPPSNRLEKLSGDRKECYSIRINSQWRICFRFYQGNFYDVEIVDYH